MLERRDAEDDVERPVRKRKLADVRDDALESRYVPLDQVDADELARSRLRQGDEPLGLGERIADVEYAALAAVPAERPRDLDGPLVEVAGRFQLVRPLVRSAGGKRACNA